MSARAALSAWLDLKAAEARTGITLVEAIEADKFEVELRRVTTSDDGRADLRRAAILAGQLGLTSDNLEPMARAWHRAKYLNGPTS